VQQAGEPVLAQAAISQAPVKRFDEGILTGLSWLNQEQPHTTLMSPNQHGATTNSLLLSVRMAFGRPHDLASYMTQSLNAREISDENIVYGVEINEKPKPLMILEEILIK